MSTRGEDPSTRFVRHCREIIPEGTNPEDGLTKARKCLERDLFGPFGDAPEMLRFAMTGATGLARVAGDFRGALEFLPQVILVYQEIARRANDAVTNLEQLLREVREE